MTKGALFSALLHGLIAFFLLVGLPWHTPLPVEPPRPIPVEVVRIDQVSKAKSLKARKREKTPEPDQVVDKKSKVKPSVQEATVPEPKPDPKPETVAKPKEEVKLAEEKPKETPKEKPKVKEDPKDLIADKLSDLAMLETKEEKKPKKEEKKEEKKPKDAKKDKKAKIKKDFLSVLENVEKVKSSDPAEKMDNNSDDLLSTEDNAAAEIGEELTASEIDLFQQQIKPCWNIPAGGKGIEEMVVPVRIHFRPDGTVRDAEYMESLTGKDGVYRALAESALRAVKDERCQPYPLSQDRLSKPFVLRFSPKGMM